MSAGPHGNGAGPHGAACGAAPAASPSATATAGAPPTRTDGEPSEALRTAVALRYDGDGAPRVVAKGRGEIAERILAVAEEHAVPLHADRGLVELLSRIDLGDEIPPELYVAVAQVLAFAYSLSARESHAARVRELTRPAPRKRPHAPDTAHRAGPSRQ